MKKFLTLAVVFAAALSIGFAADEKPKAKGKGDPAAAFKKMDADADGKLTEAEWLASPGAKKATDAGKDPKKGFVAKDKDKSGDLSLEEFSAVPAPKKPKTE